jgi:hypothetical protein
MEKDDFLEDDFLRDLIKRSPLDSPSDSFVDQVMASIKAAPETAEVKRPFYMYLKSAVPYAGVLALAVVVVVTSDLPFFSWLPGKDLVAERFLTYSGSILSLFKGVFASKFVIWGVCISLAAGVLHTIDRFFSRRSLAG